MPRFKDLTGRVVGRLTILGVSHKVKGVYYWHCACSCGNHTIVCRNSLQSEKSKSCGCLGAESSRLRATTHGLSKTLIYKVWSEMVNRATNPDHANARYYLERGIGVSEDWRKFENFYADMGDRPPGFTLDRIDNNKGYSKENCRWVEMPAQCSNKRSGSNSSGRVGVYLDSEAGKWRVTLTVKGRKMNFGRFESYDAACAAIERAELEHLGYSRKEGFIV